MYEGVRKKESFPVDGKAYYIFGREPSAVDITLTGTGASRQHAALVHHEDGKTYLIDLQSVRFVRGSKRLRVLKSSFFHVCRRTVHFSKGAVYLQTSLRYL